MKLQRLEAARGFAALYVLMHHAIPRHSVWSYPFRFGQEAVILFFVLSGFVICYAWSRRSESWGAYLKARTLRIFVPLLPVLLLGWALRGGNPLDGLAGNLAMLQDLDLPGTIVAPYKGNTPLWSLSYEWWFYIAFIPLTMLGKRATWAVVLIGVVSAVAYRWFPSWPLRWGFHLSLWWAGAMLAKDYLSNQLSVRAAWPLLIVTTTLGLAVLPGMAWPGFGGSPFLEFRHLLAGLIIIGSAFAWRAIGWAGYRWTLRPFAIVAPISYGLYIVHRPLLSLAHGFWQAVAAIAAALALAFVLERVIYPWAKSSLRYEAAV